MIHPRCAVKDTAPRVLPRPSLRPMYLASKPVRTCPNLHPQEEHCEQTHPSTTTANSSTNTPITSAIGAISYTPSALLAGVLLEQIPNHRSHSRYRTPERNLEENTRSITIANVVAIQRVKITIAHLIRQFPTTFKVTALFINTNIIVMPAIFNFSGNASTLARIRGEDENRTGKKEVGAFVLLIHLRFLEVSGSLSLGSSRPSPMVCTSRKGLAHGSVHKRISRTHSQAPISHGKYERDVGCETLAYNKEWRFP